ncbi:MAG TPA: MFS transporter [Thermoplasmata archaeon]|nr:MFS transporter [Thermoplasmata archaeon]
MERNVRWLGVAGAIRATGMSLIVPYFALYLRHVLGLGFEEIGLLAAVVGIVPLATVPFAGLVTDRLGRRRLFLVALVAEATSILGAAYAMDLRLLVGLLVAVAAAQTVGTIAGPALSAYVADFTQASERTLGFTWVRIGWNVGFTLGVFSGGALIGLVGFVTVGVAAGGVLLAGTIAVALVLEPSPYDRALAERSRVGAPGRTPRPPVSASVRTLLADRPFLALCAAVALAELTVGQWGTIFPVYSNVVLGVPYSILGLGLAFNGVLVVVAQAPTTRAAIGHRHTSVLALGIGLYAAGFVFLSTAHVFVGGVVATFFVAVFVLTMGENVMSIPTTTLPSNLAPAAEIGAYNGAFFAIMGAGQLLAPAVGGLALAAIPNPYVLWTLLALPSLPAIALILGVVGPRLRPTANRA